MNDENNYTDSRLKPTKKLQKELFNEMKNRIKKDDSSVPYFYNEYWYIKKYIKGKDYPIYTRKHKSLDNKEEVLIDVNILAKDLNGIIATALVITTFFLIINMIVDFVVLLLKPRITTKD